MLAGVVEAKDNELATQRTELAWQQGELSRLQQALEARGADAGEEALACEHMASLGAHAAKWHTKLHHAQKLSTGACGLIARALENERHLTQIIQVTLAPPLPCRTGLTPLAPW